MARPKKMKKTDLWLRLWCDFLTDPKVQMLSEADQRRYLMVLILKRQGELEKMNDDSIAFALRINSEEWKLTRENLLLKGLIDTETGTVTIPTWSKRQPNDPTGAERQRRLRNGRVTVESRESNGRVTVESRPDTDTDTDTDTEKRRDGESVEGAPPSQGDGEKPTEKPQRHDPTPYAEILKSYHDNLPTLQRVLVYSDDIRANVRQRYREDDARHDIEWWHDYFRSVERSSFLMGHTDKPFNCTFQWLVGKRNMSKVLNGQYIDRERKSAGARLLDQMIEGTYEPTADQ